MAIFCRLSFNAAGAVLEVIKPNDDGTLNDSTYPGTGSVAVSVPLDGYNACRNERDMLALALPYVADKNGKVAAAITTKIKGIDDALEASQPDPPAP